MCGRQVDTFESDHEYPPRVLIARTVRCQACGGAPTLNGDFTRILVRDEVVEWPPPTRPGRSPKVRPG